ncbi:DUF309 domain-containing protein [Candidatus Nitrospira bockiana]
MPPRYSSRALPGSRYVPGRTDRPGRPAEPLNQGEARTIACDPSRWRDNAAYVYAVDLYNFGYWWESHEVLEELWNAAGRTSEPGRFYRALIQVAAANLKRTMGVEDAARRLYRRGSERLAAFPSRYMGVEVERFRRQVQSTCVDSAAAWPVIFLETIGARAVETQDRRVDRKERRQMTEMTYPRSPKLLLGGIAHLARLIDKIRLRHAGRIQDYNYLSTGFDKYLLDLLGIPGTDMERRVLEGGSDEEILAWVKRRGRLLSDEEIRAWNERVLTGKPKDEGARQRFAARLADVAAKRGVAVSDLPAVTTWADVIELDEGRL